MRAPLVAVLTGAACLLAAAPAVASVDYGPISHSGLKSAGAASPGLKLSLQLGLIADNDGVDQAAKSASSPGSASYGKYPSLSTLASKYGATSSVRNAVTGVFKPYGNTATADVTHLRMSVTISIATAQKVFATKWELYHTGTAGQLVALPVNTPKLPNGLAGNVDTIAGLRLNVTTASASQYTGGTPTRTGTAGANCLAQDDPLALASGSGLFPNQILSAYGIAPLHAAGVLGQGVRVAIVGEGPTPNADLNAFRSCFGLPGSALEQHGSSSTQPILESSLDAQVVAMTAPQLTGFDLYYRTLNEDADDGDVLGFLNLLAAPLQATANGAPPPNVVSVSYGECEPVVAPYTASRTIVERELAAYAALGITVVVAAGDSGSSACAHGVPANQLTAADKQIQTSWPATSPWVLAAGGTNLTLDAANAIAATGPWNDTAYPSPYTAAAGGGGGLSTIVSRPWWQPKQPYNASQRMVPDIALFADESPGYAIVCSTSVQGCGASYRNGQSIADVGGTSGAAPLTAGMIALWIQQARQRGLPKPGFVPPLLYSLAARGVFVDVSAGNNAVFGGSCCNAGPGYDLATGLGSPLANLVAAALPGA